MPYWRVDDPWLDQTVIVQAGSEDAARGAYLGIYSEMLNDLSEAARRTHAADDLKIRLSNDGDSKSDFMVWHV
jgi:hypothetical protein